MPALLDVADDLNVGVRTVDADDWEHDEAKGVCTKRSPMACQPVVELKARES